MLITSNVLDTQILKRVKLEYLLSLPEGYGDDPAAKWGLIVFLHGMDRRGEDLAQLHRYGILAVDADLPFIIAVPQCPSESFWNMERDAVMAMIQELIATYPIDAARVSLIGYSMGGYGAWDLATQSPHTFSAVVSISSGGPFARAALLKETPVWAFHGALDEVVPVGQTLRMTDAIRSYCSEVKLTIYPDGSHDILDLALNDSQLYDWLRSVPCKPIHPRT